jgi:NDP-sugar pyrophosphorylase family protein
MSDNENVQAIILAGGRGMRLRPYTELIPKPLVSIHGMPVVEIVLRQLARHKFRNVVITLGHEAELIRAHFGDGAYLGLNISYVEEEKPLGTAGPLRMVDDLDESFLVLNGDLITDLDFTQFFQQHRQNNSLLTISAHERSIPIEFGVIKHDSEDVEKVTGYVEKPNLIYRVSMGVYAFNRAVLKYIPKGRHYDFPDLVQQLLEKDQDVRQIPFEGYWLDIGSGADYERALEEFPDIRDRLIG